MELNLNLHADSMQLNRHNFFRMESLFNKKNHKTSDVAVTVLPLVNGARPEGPSDSGRTRFFPVGTDRPARRRPVALDSLDRPGHSRPLLGRLGLGKMALITF